MNAVVQERAPRIYYSKPVEIPASKLHLLKDHEYVKVIPDQKLLTAEGMRLVSQGANISPNGWVNHKEAYLQPNKIRTTTFRSYLDNKTPVNAVVSSYYLDNGGVASGYLSLDEKVLVQRIRISPHAKLANEIAGYRYHDHVGSDPEIFIVDENNNIVPAFTFLQPQAATPSPVFADGFAAEITPSAGQCLDGQRMRLRDLTYHLERTVAGLPNGARLSTVNTVEIPEEQMAKYSDEQIMLGCSPSLNAYGEDTALANVDPRQMRIRSAGGHMHFTLNQTHAPRKIDKPAVVRALDRTLGVLSVLMFQGIDDPRRRQYYGRAGEYRDKSYGIEYRVLSNAWMIHPLVFNVTWEIARRCIGAEMLPKDGPMQLFDTDELEARECINTMNVGMAKRIVERNRGVYEALLWSLGTYLMQSGIESKYTQEFVKFFDELITEGVAKKLPHPNEFTPLTERNCSTIYTAWSYISSGRSPDLGPR